MLRNIAISVLVAASVGFAQVPLLQVSAPHAGPHGWQVTVTNNYSAAATAYWINLEGDRNTGTPATGVLARHWVDAIPGPKGLRLAIMPGQSRRLAFGSRSWQSVSYHDAAVLYADGTSAGDPAIIARFLRIRTAEAADLAQAMAILAQAEANGAHRAALAQAFGASATAHQAAWKDNIAHVSDRVCKTAAANLVRTDQSRALAFEGLRIMFTQWQSQLQAAAQLAKP